MTDDSRLQKAGDRDRARWREMFDQACVDGPSALRLLKLSGAIPTALFDAWSREATAAERRNRKVTRR
jgi:hypothetical protein